MIPVALLAASSFAGNFYSGTSPANVPWPGGVVAYAFTNTLTAAQQQTYLAGLREWELAANVRFVPRTTETRWILFAYNTNGFDNVSSGYDPQVVSVSSLSRAQVCHEMGHSFGFTHENIRPDATDFITVVTNNIQDEPNNIVWFTVDPTSVTHGPYDFESVMHLGWDFDSVQPGVLPTQEPKPSYFPRYQFRMGNLCLSPGDRAALAFLYGPPAVPLTSVVTTTADVGLGSLRAAMYYAADHPGSGVSFNIPTTDHGYSNGVFTIQLTGHLPPLAADGMVIDGSTQPGFNGQPLIVVDGSQILPETFTSNSGLLIYSANNQVKSVSFHGFNWNGLTFRFADATNNVVAGCWLGLDSTGSNAAPNLFQGILLAGGASGNVIGGTSALARNVLSGNQQYGIYVTDSNTAGNVILGNFIGTDASGSNAVPNWSGGAIIVHAAHNNLIGGTDPLAHNVISGNTNFGIWIGDVGTVSNTVSGNLVGLNAAGTAALPNTFTGMYLIDGAQNNLVTRNVFSGHPSEGLRISGSGTSGNLLQGNSFGTDAGGTNAVPNGFAGATIFSGATSNVIGGTSVAARNLISGNSSYGVVIGDPGSSGNRVEGNFIGTDLTGTHALGNSFANVALWNGATGNSIGGVAAGSGNVIAFSGNFGVVLYDNATISNAIRGNSIFANGGLGIDLNGDGVTPNDPGDTDTGPDNLQNFPVITRAADTCAGTIVSGTLNSTASRGFFIDVYRNTAADASGNGEGEVYVGSVTNATDGSGNAAFSLTLNGHFAGQYFSATATDHTTGDTSEFSASILATNGPAPFARDAAYTRAPGLSLKIRIADIACDASGNPVTVTSLGPSTQGAGLSFDSTDIFYLPANNSDDSFSYTVSNGNDSASGTIAVTVTPSGGIAKTITVSAGTATIKFFGIPGLAYDVQRAPSLAEPVTWTTLTSSAVSPGADGSFTFTDNLAPNGTAYYRSVQRP
jgi:hypothetical protein